MDIGGGVIGFTSAGVDVAKGSVNSLADVLKSLTTPAGQRPGRTVANIMMQALKSFHSIAQSS